MGEPIGVWRELADKTARERAGDGSAVDARLWAELKARTDLPTYMPKLIDDAVIVRLEDSRHGPYYVLKNPHTLKYLRLAPEDHFLVTRMDGQYTVRYLVMAYYNEFKSFALNRITGLLAELKADGFLDEESARIFESLRQEVARRRWGYRAGRLVAAFFQYPFTLHGLDRFVSGAHRRFLWVLFTRPALLLYAIISLVGVAMFVDHFTNEKFDLFKVGGSYELGIVTLLLIDVFVIMLHEGSHAFTTKAYGRDVIRGGFLVYIGMPAFFVDTTDIWLSEKRARVAVSWAGPYSELIMGGVCSILIGFMPDAAASEFLFKFAFFFYLGAFLNLNPLLELDGYYILMDWLEIPLLRSRSMAFVKGPLWSRLWRREKLSREERIFAVYGLAAIAYLVFAIVVVLYFWQAHLSEMLVEMWGSGEAVKQILAAAIFLGIAIPLGYVAVVKGWALLRGTGQFLVRYRILIEARRLAVFLALVSLALVAPSYLGWTAGWDWRYRMALHAVVLVGAVAAMLAAPRLGIPPAAAWWPWLPLLATFAALPCIHYLQTRDPRWFPVAWPDSAVATLVCCLAALLGLTHSLSVGCRVPRSLSDRHWRRAFRLAGLISGVLAFGAATAVCLLTMDWIPGVPELSVSARMVLAGATVLLSLGLLLAAVVAWRGTRFALGAVLLLAGAAMVINSYSDAMAMPGGSGVHASPEVNARWRDATWWELAGFLLVASAFAHYMVQAGRSPWRKVKAQTAPLARDIDRVTAAFNYLALNLAASYSCLVGRWRAESVLAVAEQAVGMPIRPPEDPRTPVLSGGVVRIGQRYEDAIEEMWRHMRWVVGPKRLAEWVDLLLEHVPWQQREAAVQYFVGQLDVENVWEEAFASRKAEFLRTLSSNPILAELSDEEKEAVAALLRREHYDDGDRIIRQGEAGDKFYVIDDGPVEVLVADAKGDERPVATLGEGDYFGEIALLERVPRTASCVARAKVTVLSLSADDFQRVVARYFEALGKVGKATIRAGLLARIPLFGELDARQIREILQKMTVEIVHDNEVVIRQDDLGEEFYVIAEGQVRVLVADDDDEIERAEGREVAQLGVGEYFGEIALLANMPRTASVRAVGDAELLVLSKAAFSDVVASNLMMAQQLEQVGSRRRLDIKSKLRGDKTG